MLLIYIFLLNFLLVLFGICIKNMLIEEKKIVQSKKGKLNVFPSSPWYSLLSLQFVCILHKHLLYVFCRYKNMCIWIFFLNFWTKIGSCDNYYFGAFSTWQFVLYLLLSNKSSPNLKPSFITAHESVGCLGSAEWFFNSIWCWPGLQSFEAQWAGTSRCLIGQLSVFKSIALVNP